MSYDRRYNIYLDDELFIEGGDGRQLRITFTVSTGYSGYAGTGELAIYNLSPASRGMITSGSILRLECGYADDIGGIYTGLINNVLLEREGTDILVRVLMVAKTKPIVKINKTYPVNTKVATVVQDCAIASKYRLDWNRVSFDSIPPMTRGLTISNRDPVDVISELATQHEFNMVVQNEIITINKQIGDQGDTPLTIGEFTGMEMMPEVSEAGINITTRLNAKLSVGRLFEVDARYRTFTMANAYYDFSDTFGDDLGRGVYSIFKIDHVGDSWGSAWSSQIEGLNT